MNETGTPPNEREPALSPVLIQLFKGVLYRDDSLERGRICCDFRRKYATMPVYSGWS